MAPQVTRRTAACTSSCWRRRRRAGRSCSMGRRARPRAQPRSPPRNPPTRPSASPQEIFGTHYAPHGTRTRVCLSFCTQHSGCGVDLPVAIFIDRTVCMLAFVLPWMMLVRPGRAAKAHAMLCDEAGHEGRKARRGTASRRRSPRRGQPSMMVASAQRSACTAAALMLAQKRLPAWALQCAGTFASFESHCTHFAAGTSHT